jgi:gliding motility-associated-like protein
MIKKNLLCVILLSLSSYFLKAQFPGCPNIIAGPDQTLPCNQNCTTISATPFHAGQTNTYTVSSIPHTPPIAYNQPGGTAVSVGTDDVWSPIINLPFPFCFYGQTYTTCKVGSNGAILFNPATGGGYHPWPIAATDVCPSPALWGTGNRGHIFGVYHDIDPTVAGTVRWYLLGTAPCRIFVVSFNQLGHYSCTSLRSTHMMVLYETTNVIDVYVNNKATCTSWNGGRAVIGIQNTGGTAGIAPAGRNANTTWTVTTPEAWRFTPNGAPIYTVQWFQGATLIGTGNSINVCPAGTTTYTAQVTYTRCDGLVITDQDQIVVNYSGLTAPTVTPVHETCNNYNNGSVTIDNPVGAGPYTVQINGPVTATVVEPNTPAGTANFTNLPDGNYTYTVTGNSGCTYSGSFTINPGPPCCNVLVNGTNITCNGGSNGTATASPTGLGPFSYSWSPSGGTGQTATGLTANTYTVTMTDASGCVATANINITQPPAIIANANVTSPTCNGSCNGSITVTASGGTGTLQYSYNGGPFQTSNVFNGLCAGPYTITVQDGNNCTQTLNGTISEPTALVLNLNATTPATCGNNNGTANLSVSGGSGGPHTYTLNPGNIVNTTGSYTNLAPGNYTVTVSNAAGCTAGPVNVTIGMIPAPVANIQSQTNVSCFGGANGSVLIGLSGGGPPTTYSITGPVNAGPQASNTFTNLLAGNYTATVVTGGCNTTVTFTITQPTQLVYASVPTAATCNGVCDGQIQINANGGTPPYQYSSNNGLTFGSANPMTGLCAGLINVVVQDANGCLANSQVNITQPAAVGASFVNTPPVCHNGCNGQIVVTANGGTAPYQYSANGGPLQGSNTLTGLCSGNNTIVVQDANGCQFSSVQNLTNPPQINISVVSTTPSNCGFNDGAFQVSASGTTGPYSYDPDGGGPMPANGTGIFNNVLAGGYNVVVTDANGCQNNLFVGVNDVQMSGQLLGLTNATCFGSCDGTVQTINTAGSAPISFELDNSGVTQGNGNFSGLCAGSHIVTIYDNGFCIYTIPFTITEPAAISFSSTVGNVSCNGAATGSITFNNVQGGSGAYQYSINGGVTFQGSPNFTGLTAGTYNLLVQDANGCTGTGTATITQASPIQVVTNVTDLTCNGNNSGVVQLVAGGGTPGYTYSFNGSPFGANFTFFGQAAGTYNYQVQDAAGCQFSGTVTVNQPPVLAANYAPTAATCNGVCDGQIVVTANGGTAPYQYSSNNGVTYQISNTLANLCAGSHQIQVKDANNCLVGTTINITQPTAVVFNTVITPSTCGNPNGSITINANGGTPGYTYSNNGGATFQAGNNFSGLAANTYNLVVQDANNCPATATATVPNEASPVITSVFTSDVTCNGSCNGSITVNANGGTGALQYSIGGPNQMNGNFTNVCANNYTITVTDANGCTDTQNTVVTEPPALVINATPVNLLCYNDNSGQINVAVNGGVSPYLYSYDGGATYGTLANQQFLAAGNYNVFVQDANNCTASQMVNVTQPTQLQIQNQTEVSTSCNGICDGQANITIQGGTVAGLYTYTWSGGVAGPNQNVATNLCAGTYTVDVNDDNGCAIQAVFNITEPPAVIITSINATEPSCNNGCDATITMFATTAVQYSVDNGITFQPSNNFTNLCAGNYSIVVQDANNCPAYTTITINNPAPVVLDPIADITICYDGYGTLSANANGGTGLYYYVWNTGDTTQFLNVNVHTQTVFTCVAYDMNGCASNQQSVTVNVLPQFYATVSPDVTICPGNSVTLTANGFDGIGNYDFQWLNQFNDTLGVGSSFTYIPSSPETITLVGVDQCPTYDTLQVNISFYPLPQPAFTATPTAGCSPLLVTFNNTTPPAMIGNDCMWIFGDGNQTMSCNSVTNTYLNPGCYDVTLIVTSPDGCVGTNTLTNYICVHPDPVADFTWTPQQPTILNSEVQFTDLSTGASTYNWDIAGLATATSANPIFNFMNQDTGQYQVCLTVTSINGCVHDTCKLITLFDEFLIYVPNAFTPDGDGVNDIFLPSVVGIDPLRYEFMIFNRWGELIFETSHKQIGWDGTHKGMTVKEDVYVWKIKLKEALTGKERTYTGHVTLLK